MCVINDGRSKVVARAWDQQQRRGRRSVCGDYSQNMIAYLEAAEVSL